MRVAVDPDVCAGHGVCCTICPEVFELTDDGYSSVRVDEVPPDLEGRVADAVQQCPAQAISVS